MSNSLQRIVSIVLYILMAVGIIFGILFYFGKETPGITSKPYPAVTDSAIRLLYVYFAIAALTAILFPLIHVIRHPGKAKLMLLGLIVFGVILLIGYVFGTDTPLPVEISKTVISAKSLKLVDGGLKALYIFLGIGFLSILYYEISSIFK